MTSHFDNCARAAMILFSALMATGCGGGGGSLAEGGISGTGKTVAGSGSSSGTISGFGSVITNGIKFNTDNTDILFNGVNGDVLQLEAGMVVSINGVFSTEDKIGDANSLEFDYSVSGNIQNIDGNIIEINGQNLLVDSQTRFKNGLVSDLLPGDAILASGNINANGEIQATYIEKQVSPASSFVIIEGVVENIDAIGRTFQIQNKRSDALDVPRPLVDFSSAALQGFENNSVFEGAQVHIEGSLQNLVLSATLIKTKNQVAGVDDSIFLLDGLVESIQSTDSLLVSGNAIRIDTGTEIIGGSIFDIGIDSRVLIEGRVDTDGSLLAETIDIVTPPTLEISAVVTAVNPVSGSIDLLGAQLVPDSFTIFVDESIANNKQFSIGELSVGDRVHVNAYSKSSGTFIAKLTRVDPVTGDPASIEGPVDPQIVNPLFSIGGVTIDTSGLNDAGDISRGDLFPVSRNELFQTLREGMGVKASGVQVGSQFSVTRVDLLSCCRFLTIDPAGFAFSGASDVSFNWDGTLYTDPLTQTAANFSISSAMPFFGMNMIFHDGRIFGTGNYSFTTTRGNTLNLPVNENQVGAHLRFDWGFNKDMDVVLVWNRDGIYTGSTGTGNDFGAKGLVFSLATADGDGDGNPGIPMVDGPFQGFQFIFNLSAHLPP